MLSVVIGITYGLLVGFGTNAYLFRALDRDLKSGQEPTTSIGGLFFLRYLIDAAALLVFRFVTGDDVALVAAALCVTIAVKVSVLRYYWRKGGRID